MSTTAAPYRTQEEIVLLVQAFEACTLDNARFDHPAHMTVALWYLIHLPYEDAVATMRAGIRRFAAARRHDHLYHETITLFWMKLLRHFLDLERPNQPIPDLVYRAITTLGNQQLIFKHYNHAILFSPEARQNWVEPDLSPLPDPV